MAERVSESIPPTLKLPRFTEADAERAWKEWGANCGPGALAAISGLTLDEVRLHLGDFERKGYTNPTLMYAALDSIAADWWKIGREWPEYGLARIQWEGPWTAPGVPARAAYRHTHWVGAARIRGERGVFDINCINNGTGWVSLRDWSDEIAPFLTTQIRRASGKWHVVTGLEVRIP